MAVITISREMGSAGDWEGDMDYVPARLIEKTGYHYADKKFLSQVFREYGLVSFDREYASYPSFWERLDTHRGEERADIVDLLNRATMALAHHGNMILIGRGNFAMLQGMPDVLNVRLQADLPSRITSTMKRFNLTDRKAAEEIVTKNDKLRESFVEEFYKVRGDWAEGFDLVLNTTKTGIPIAVEAIMASVRHMESHAGTGPHCGSLPVLPDMVDTVKTLLACQKVHRN